MSLLWAMPRVEIFFFARVIIAGRVGGGWLAMFWPSYESFSILMFSVKKMSFPAKTVARRAPRIYHVYKK